MTDWGFYGFITSLGAAIGTAVFSALYTYVFWDFIQEAWTQKRINKATKIMKEEMDSLTHEEPPEEIPLEFDSDAFAAANEYHL